MIQRRDEVTGQSTEAKRKLRAGYLPAYTQASGADAWELSGKAIVLQPVEKEVKE